jgi:hypothetical protein
MANDKFSLGPVERGTDVPNRNGVLWVDTSTTPDTVKIQVNESNAAVPEYVTFETGATAGGGGTPNDLLDGSAHQDTTAGTVVRGDIITGQGATPTWKRLAKGAQGKVLLMGANEPYWGASGAWDANARLLGRRVFIGAVFGFNGAVGAAGGAPERNVFGSQTDFTVTTGVSAVTTDASEQRGHWTATTTGVCSLRSANGPSGHTYPYLRVYARLDDGNDGNFWIGMSSGTLPNTADPGALNVVAFRARNGTDTNFMAVTSEQAGGTDGATDTTIPIDANWHLFEIVTEDGGSSYDFYIDGDLVASRSGSTLPPVTSQFGCRVELPNITSSTRTFSIKSLILATGDPALGLADSLANGYLDI